MNPDQFEATLRAGEWFHSLTVPPGMWIVLRMDGRGFTRFTEAAGFEKPFDQRFSEKMIHAAGLVLTDFQAVYAYTESDEISILLPAGFDMFGWSVEKLVSLSAAAVSAAFTDMMKIEARFDSRIWMGSAVDDVVDYFSWRQADAGRCALSGWCYWTLHLGAVGMGEQPWMTLRSRRSTVCVPVSPNWKPPSTGPVATWIRSTVSWAAR